MEYYKNLDLADIVYLCEVDQVEKIEQWKDVVDYEGLYKVSDLGRVKSFLRCRGSSLRIIKQTLNKSGYCSFSLMKKGIRKNIKTNIVVGKAFMGYVYDKKLSVLDHINTNEKTNNTISNLNIVTARENTAKDKKSSTGIRGVHKVKNKFVASLSLNGKTVNLGTFDNSIEASDIHTKAVNLINEGKSIDHLVKKRSNKYGYTGVISINGKFNSIYVHNKVRIYLGTFETPEDAYDAYLKCKLKHTS